MAELQKNALQLMEPLLEGSTLRAIGRALDPHYSTVYIHRRKAELGVRRRPVLDEELPVGICRALDPEESFGYTQV